MKWDEQVNKAIDYVEANLEGKIDMDEVAKIMCQPKISFQRTFSLVMNISINEYIRSRRMTLAAISLRNGSEKVVDLALKYGFESPASFARSFKEFHGISPTMARKKDAQLNLFPRITCLLTVKGGKQMDYKYEGMGEQVLNRGGLDWVALKTMMQPNLEVYDSCINTANKWKKEGHKCLLDLGTGLGQNAIYFARHGFNVSAMDISDYAVQYLENWATKENLTIRTKVGDMHSLPYENNSFDCLYAYHVVSHTDTIGLSKIIIEIERVLKPNGEVYLSFCSKESTPYMDNLWPKFDENTLISQTAAEMGIPHYYADFSDVQELLKNFTIENIMHRGYFKDDDEMKLKFLYVNARLKSSIM